ncbi:MAG: AAA family ATPase [Lentisphaeria bacterium]
MPSEFSANDITLVQKTAQILRTELSKVIIGQEKIVNQIIITLFAGGHALLTGVPGLGKTLLIKSIAQMLSLSFQRIQFTPDLMPADIFGTEVMEENTKTGQRYFQFIKGPIFANIVLADEINRTPPKTQSALLEAMGEAHVTTAGKTYDLEPPFFVLATQNPIELEGTYPLPEAQLDRFLLNIVMDYLPISQEEQMVKQTTSPKTSTLDVILNAKQILDIQHLVREIVAPENVISYAVRLCAATRPNTNSAAPGVNDLVKWGGGSRASQALILAGKAKALLDGRCNVSCEDIRDLVLPVLRHRVITNFRAEADGVTIEELLHRIVKFVKES